MMVIKWNGCKIYISMMLCVTTCLYNYAHMCVCWNQEGIHNKEEEKGRNNIVQEWFNKFEWVLFVI